jgi:hypothetical protein
MIVFYCIYIFTLVCTIYKASFSVLVGWIQQIVPRLKQQFSHFGDHTPDILCIGLRFVQYCQHVHFYDFEWHVLVVFIIWFIPPESKSCLTTDCQTASLSWCQHHL